MMKIRHASLLTESISSTPVSDLGRRTALAAAILASVLAIPGFCGVAALLYFGVLVIGDIVRKGATSEAATLIAVGIVVVLAALGVPLCFWYWKIALKSSGARGRKITWAMSLIYNAILLGLGFLGSFWFYSSRKPLFQIWLTGILLMIAASLGALFEELKWKETTAPNKRVE